MLQARGVDYVSRLNRSYRSADFRRGKRLCREDHIVQWIKPRKPRTIDQETYDTLPDWLTIRECRYHVDQPGFRTKLVVVVTTLLDPDEFTKVDLAGLYRARWNAELDLRDVKQSLQMDILRCKTPELVRKEIWAHVLTYNLIRTIMAQAADEHELQPRTISFKGTIQTLEAFQPVIALRADRDSTFRMHLYKELLKCVASHRVGDRPDRFEPRKRKRRFRWYDFLNKPRKEAKLDMVKGLN